MPLEPERGLSASEHFSLLSETSMHKGFVAEFFEGVIKDTSGAEYTRDIIRHPGAVAIVAMNLDGSVFLVKQYRAAVDADTWELPAGKLDVEGESPLKTAERELEEEVGVKAEKIELLMNVHHSPGFCDEYTHIFLATGLTRVPEKREGPEEAVMEIHQLPLLKAAEMVHEGKITDAKSVAGILMAAAKQNIS